MLNRKRHFTLLPAMTVLLLLVGLTLASSGSVVAQQKMRLAAYLPYTPYKEPSC